MPMSLCGCVPNRFLCKMTKHATADRPTPSYKFPSISNVNMEAAKTSEMRVTFLLINDRSWHFVP